MKIIAIITLILLPPLHLGKEEVAIISAVAAHPINMAIISTHELAITIENIICDTGVRPYLILQRILDLTYRSLGDMLVNIV